MKIHISLPILCLICLLGCKQQSAIDTINLADYIPADSVSSTTYDATFDITRALSDCKEMKASKLVIPKAIYRITPNYASEKYVFVSNNDAGLKAFLFDLSNISNLEIDGNGSEFILEGFICPFLLDNSINITIKNLSIDFKRPFHTEGLIIGSGKGYIDLKFSDEFPYEVKNGKLRFIDRNGTLYPYGNLLEFNAGQRETEFKVFDNWLFTSPLPAETLPNNDIRMYKEDIIGKTGNIMVFGASNRLIPAFTISDSENILLSNINIYHCGGMGVIGQRTKNIELNKVMVSPRPDGKRIISATADATHFVNCSGYLRMIDCTFENQKDDATNIHGIYAVVDKIISQTEIIVRMKHRQQFGFDFIKKGMSVEFEDARSLISKGICKIKEVKRLNKECTFVTFSDSIPSSVRLKDPMASIEAYPEVLIKGCTIQKNRARGLLLGSRAKIVIENNYFHTPGSAILFEGDGCYWYEQSGVRDVIIRNNIFDNCNFGNDSWGIGCIGVNTLIMEDKDKSRYHRNIVVTDNQFNIFDPTIAYLYCVDGFTFKNNKIQQSDKYKHVRTETRRFVTEDCSNISIED